MTLAPVMNDTQSCVLTSTPGFTGFRSTTLIISLVILYHFYAKKGHQIFFFSYALRDDASSSLKKLGF